MLIYGTGGHSKVVFDSLSSSGIKVLGFFDDSIRLKVFKDLQVTKYSKDHLSKEKVIIAIGDNRNRKKVSVEIQHRIGKVVDGHSLISPESNIGNGSMVLQGVVIQTGTQIGEHVIVNTSASVDHDCIIGDFSHIAPNATLCGNVTVGEGTLVGAGSVIVPGIVIGRWSIIGAGSVVVRNVPDFTMVAGNPARIVKPLNPQ